MYNRNKNYISSPKRFKQKISFLGSSFMWERGYWTAEEKVEINKIKFDKLPYVDHCKLDKEYVKGIVSDFYLEVWEPIRVNDEYVLVDGQHRIAAAKIMGLKYIDVIICKSPDEIDKLEEERNKFKPPDFMNLKQLNREINRLKNLKKVM